MQGWIDRGNLYRPIAAQTAAQITTVTARTAGSLPRKDLQASGVSPAASQHHVSRVMFIWPQQSGGILPGMAWHGMGSVGP